jgi:predicted nucleic acid-binding protein
VKLVLSEPGSADMQALRSQVTVLAAARIAYAELRAAVAAANRDGRLAAGAHVRAKRQVEVLWRSTSPIDIDQALVSDAGDFAEQYGLRGYDAVHLAALQRLAAPSSCTLACWDRDLRRAASSMGYALHPRTL